MIITKLKVQPYLRLQEREPLEFQNCPCNTNFLPQFPSAYKTHQFTPAAFTSNCLNKTSLGWHKYCVYFLRWLFSLVLCWKASEYWSRAILSQTLSSRKECYQWWLLYGKKIKIQNIFAWYTTQMFKISSNFLKKMLRNCLRIS